MSPSQIIVATAVLAVAASSVSAQTVFSDTFNRPDSRNIGVGPGALPAGVTNNTGTDFTTTGVYSTPFVDPANATVQDGDPLNGGGTAIVNNALNLAIGAGTSNAYVNHNFTNSAFLANGNFTVSLDVTKPAGTAKQQGGAFAIGMTAAEAALGGDSFNDGVGDIGGPAYTFAFNAAAPDDGVAVTNTLSDFWVALRANGTLSFGGGGGVAGTGGTVTTIGGLATSGTISATFTAADFNAGSTVGVQVFLDGALQGTTSFQWSDSNANYIGLDARDGTAVPLDNFVVSTTPVPEPASLAALALGTGLLGLRRRR